jgi:error-prone DNA polymerase
MHGRRTQRRGTYGVRWFLGAARGFIFLGLKDETGISDAIIQADLYEQNRVAVTRGKFLMAEGIL